MKGMVKVVGEAIVNIIKVIKCNCKSGCCESDCNRNNEELENRIEGIEKQIEINRKNILENTSYI